MAERGDSSGSPGDARADGDGPRDGAAASSPVPQTGADLLLAAHRRYHSSGSEEEEGEEEHKASHAAAASAASPSPPPTSRSADGDNDGGHAEPSSGRVSSVESADDDDGASSTSMTPRGRAPGKRKAKGDAPRGRRDSMDNLEISIESLRQLAREVRHW